MDSCPRCLVPPPLLTAEEGSDLTPSSVLLDVEAYISSAAVSNATTAVGYMSTNKPIHITFYLARPPRLSYLCAHFPGPAAANSLHPDAPAVRCIKNSPIVISTHADLALLHVTQPGARDLRNDKYHDYFVYTARPRGPLLHLLPYPPASAGFQDNEVAIFCCSGGGGSRFVIAALRNTTDPKKFKLQRYDSDTCRWTSTVLYIVAAVRDIVLPIPYAATELSYHSTDKVITLGGRGATIGWVDLWRGILLCDVLDQKPRLRDVPLPKPSSANIRSFCRGGPRPTRDIAVVTLPEEQHPIKIKYIEMEIRPGEDLPPPRQSDSYDDASRVCVAPYWSATIWTMPLPIGSWRDWHKDCKVDVTDIVVKNQRHLQQLMMLPQLTTTDDPQNMTMRLRRLHAGHPTLGLGEHGDLIIYFLSKMDIMDDKGWVMAVGAMDKMLRGIAELDSRKNKHWRCCYAPTEIFKHLIKATGENVAKCGEAGAVYNRQAAEEMEDSDQGRQTRGAGHAAAKEVPRNFRSSIQFGSFPLEMIPVGSDEVVFGQ